jgi:hypothetical protein
MPVINSLPWKVSFFGKPMLRDLMIIMGKTPRPVSLSLVDLPGHDVQDVIVSFLGMGNDAVRAVLDAVPERERSIALQQIERAPAEQAGLPCIEVMARVKTAFLVGKELVVHDGNSSLANVRPG